MPLLAALSGQHPLVGLDVVFKTTTCTLPAEEMGATYAVLRLKTQRLCQEGDLFTASAMVLRLGRKRNHVTCCVAGEISSRFLEVLAPRLEAAQADARLRPVDTIDVVGMNPAALAFHAVLCLGNFRHCHSSKTTACRLITALCMGGHQAVCSEGTVARALMSICPQLHVHDFLHDAGDNDRQRMVAGMCCLIEAMLAICCIYPGPSRPHDVNDTAGRGWYDTSAP